MLCKLIKAKFKLAVLHSDSNLATATQSSALSNGQNVNLTVLVLLAVVTAWIQL